MVKKGMKILITGASGFIGSFLCEEGLKRGKEDLYANTRDLLVENRRWQAEKEVRAERESSL